MIAHLRGTVHRSDPGEVTIDVADVGYRVHVPLDVYEHIEDGMITKLWISPYIREDRFDLFGFLDRSGQTLFEALLKLSGIGPKTALELCSVPRPLLLKAAEERSPQILASVKGIGKKTAEKLVLELCSLIEKHPMILGSKSADGLSGAFDQDAIAALSQLGYDSPTIMHVLRSLPSTLDSTEERVAAALRSL
jgi:holliday junction DNA helicase RuvA